MSPNSLDREKRILEYLHEWGSASIQKLAETLGVSNMTVHRDLNRLMATGQVQKKHGGVTLPSAGIRTQEHYVCAMCGKPVSPRTVFIVKLDDGEELRACCAHCGLMLQSRSQNAWQSLTADYLYGHMLSAGQAFYLIGSELNICCVPSVLAFSSRQDAEKFQKGFGGQLLGMDETVQHMRGMMHMQPGM